VPPGAPNYLFPEKVFNKITIGKHELNNQMGPWLTNISLAIPPALRRVALNVTGQNPNLIRLNYFQNMLDHTLLTKVCRNNFSKPRQPAYRLYPTILQG